MDNYVGKRLDGRYEIHEVIGVGGMAVVYKAYDCIDQKIVAVKILKEEYLADEDFKRRFKNESKAIAVLSHPNIVKVLDVSFGDRLQYIVMEYVEGITLKEYIEQQGVVRTREALYFVMQILRALQHAHDKGIVHRDIKPQNIMLIENGSIKVTDFGIATFARGETKTMTNSAIGSVHYISPEQAKGSITDAKSDIYSVGVVLYEMLTGKLPFQSDNAVSVAVMQVQKQPINPRAINPDISIGLEQIIMRAMQKNPAERYQSAAEMLVDLGEVGRNPNVKFDYNFFVDKAPTKYIPTNEVNQMLRENEPIGQNIPVGNPTQNEIDSEERKKKRLIAILGGVLGGLVLFVVIMIIIFSSSKSKQIEVPNFVGKNFTDEISKNSNYADFLPLIETSPVSDAKDENGQPYEDGYVISQDPPAGKKVNKGTKIILNIASNKTVEVPDVFGKDSATASILLSEKGFKVTVDFDYESEATPGLVIRTSPEIGENIPFGSTVTIFVPYTGSEQEEMVVVPVLAGEQSLARAKEILESNGLLLDANGSEERDSNQPKGYILGNSFAGQMVPKGTKIAVFVSTGITRRYDIKFTLPDYPSIEGTYVVTLNEEEIESGTVVLDGSERTVHVGGSGSTNKLVITIDGQKIYSANVNFSYGISEDSSVTNIKENKYTTETTTESTTESTQPSTEPSQPSTEPTSTTDTTGDTNVSNPDDPTESTERETVNYD